MDSAGSPNAWVPYDSNRDCSQGICSMYCPQWCYYIFPPPPPDEGSGTTFSPLVIAVIGILGSAFLLVSYYTFITKYCRRRGQGIPGFEAHHGERNHDQWQIGSSGLDEGLIKSITVFKYNKGEGLVEGTECSVCLNEFQENENLRLMPKCCHAFHPPCIDTWLKSHTNCPLCRANASPTFPLPLSVPAPPSQISSTANVSAPEMQRQNDLVLEIEERERNHNQDELFVSCISDVSLKSPHQANGDAENPEGRDGRSGDQEEVRQFRRSISLGAFPSQRNLLLADILGINDKDEEDSKISQLETGIGSSKGIQEEQSKSNYIRSYSELARSPAAVKRSFSTGRFTFTRQDRDNNYIIPI